MTIRKLKKRLKLGKQHLPNKFIKSICKNYGHKATFVNANGNIIVAIYEPYFDNTHVVLRK